MPIHTFSPMTESVLDKLSSPLSTRAALIVTYRVKKYYPKPQLMVVVCLVYHSAGSGIISAEIPRASATAG